MAQRSLLADVSDIDGWIMVNCSTIQRIAIVEQILELHLAAILYPKIPAIFLTPKIVVTAISRMPLRFQLIDLSFF